ATVTWPAPMLPFTAEEAWLARYPSEEGSVHLERFPEVPSEWRDDALAERWRRVRNVRRVVTGALEIERAHKRIGSSLEAAPLIFISDADLFAALVDIDLAEVAVTPAAALVQGEGWRGRARRRRSGSRRSRASPSWLSSRRAKSARARGRFCRVSALIPPIPTCPRVTPRRCANGRRCAKRRSETVTEPLGVQ